MIDPTQPAAQAQQPGGAPALPVVCIAAQPDGSFLVYAEYQGAEAGERADDADAAAQVAVGMLSGDQAGAGSADDSNAEALFQSGFRQARGTPLGK